jgi:hypothetical protein
MSEDGNPLFTFFLLLFLGSRPEEPGRFRRGLDRVTPLGTLRAWYITRQMEQQLSRD